MSSVTGETDVSAEKEDGVAGDEAEEFFCSPIGRRPSDDTDLRIRDILAEEQQRVEEEARSGADRTSFDGYKDIDRDEESESASEVPLRHPQIVSDSPDESVSTPDDTPSVQGSILSSPGSSTPASHASFFRQHHPGALQPFERRFSSRISLSPLQPPRPLSPAFLTPRSRQSSLGSQLLQNEDESDTPQAPWEVVRWTKLKKISGQVFSEVGKRNFGKPTCLNVAASIVIGTSKGYILVFDYQQVLKSIIGPGTKAVECGSITSLAISADHSTVAGGHATGHVFTWELSRPAKPFLHIPPIDRDQLDSRRSDGHVSGAAILHIGFLGTRHTALVSADDGGMAFSQLATRGTGALGRTVKTTRILGRYPVTASSAERPRKPSSVLAFSPLPLGNVSQPTDELGLTAILTPYLLVIVSTTPIAQTQHKAPRPKELAPHSTLSGCLAWFPAVKLKNPLPDSQEPVSKTKLVYCWSNILTILDVDSSNAADRDKPAELHFQPRSRWRSEEAIVAVQWLSRSVLAVLTISQRLIILEDNSLRMTDSFDLLYKHIYHQDLFSKQLQPVVEHLDEDDVSLHGVVADAFHMSFKAYKGRLFLLGFNDVSIGTLSNWADRLLAYMEHGDFISAIELATAYYNGDADKLTVGLPDNDAARHTLVQEKLLEMISASLKYTFSRTKEPLDEEMSDRLKKLAITSFKACLSMAEENFLFEEVYEAYEEASAESIFLETLEPYILEGSISSLPPDALKDLITYFASFSDVSRLEEMLCRLETQTMDIDQVTTMCRQYNLYDALIYVWTQALHDYITPLIDLLSLIKILNYDNTEVDVVQSMYMESAMKIFPYLSYSFTGRTYPSGINLDDSEAYRAKGDLYSFLFAGRNVNWPQGSGSMFLTRSDKGSEPAFPYLRLILAFDTPSFMSMLNEAFEDSFLNGDQGDIPSANGNQVNGSHQGSSLTPTRQYIINILYGIMTSEGFDPEDTVYFFMFVARNLPKFPQYIILPGSSLHKILVGLCNYPSAEVQEDCQLSVEYLLSAYHPSDLASLVPLFEQAGFHRVLKSVYKGTKQYAKLVETYLNDVDNRDAVFDCLGDCLRPSSGLSKKQINEIRRVVLDRAQDLASVGSGRLARTLQLYVPELVRTVLDNLEHESESQYLFLKALIEPEGNVVNTAYLEDSSSEGLLERYVQLMCKYSPSNVADFVGLLRSGDLRLDPVLPALEKSGIIDAAVMLMARDGMVKTAMQRLVKHLGTLETALTGLINAAAETPDAANTEEAVEDLLDAVTKYCKVGVWLCQGQSQSTETQHTKRVVTSEDAEMDLELDELLWLELVDTVVSITKDVSSAAADLDSQFPSHPPVDTQKVITVLRSAVQEAFSALLASTTASMPSDGKSSAPMPSQPHTAFLRILRAFLIRASRSSPSLSDLRAVLAEIFSAYTFEETILSLATRFLDKDAFAQVSEVQELRQRGWRPRGQICEGCSRRAWGPSAGGDIWAAWERKEVGDEERRVRARIERGGGEEARRLARGKERAADDSGSGSGSSRRGDADSDAGVEGGTETRAEDLGPLIVFACRHMFHRKCLERAQAPEGDDGAVDPRHGHARQFRCPLCS